MQPNRHRPIGHRVLKPLSISLAMCLALQPVQAAVSISSSPLLTDSSVPPNIMFVLDDSGSMQWEAMPDSLRFGAINYVFPLPNNGNGDNIYGASRYSEVVPDFDDDNQFNLLWRSPSNNAVFYDPAVDYAPWKRFNGTAHVSVTGNSAGDVSPTNAPYNPAVTARGSLNLNPSTALSMNARWVSRWGGICSNCSETFWPVTFYIYKGAGSTTSADSYVRYQIRNSVGYKKDPAGSGTNTVIATFDWTDQDGNAFSRDATAELQNFANWFSYYRSRLLAARGGASLAFADVDTKKRVGFTTINHPGEGSYSELIDPTKSFETSTRQAWFDRLLGVNVSTNGTPLRSALQWAGEYYSQAAGETNNPWKPLDEAECRRSFTILTSDGYWNGSYPRSGVNTDGSVGNADGSDGTAYTSNLDGVPSAGYTAGPPFEDSYSNTLADVAMHYWKTDLQTTVENKVSPTPTDPAYWQHMNTFTLSIGVQGTLDPETVQGDETFAAWTNPSSGSDLHKIDDLLHAAINGRGKFVPAQNPQEFAEGLSNALKEIDETAGSASSLSGNTTSVQTGSAVYQARYSSNSWSGDLVAWALDSTTGDVQVTIGANNQKRGAWFASEQMPSPANRKIYTSVTGAPGSIVEFATSTAGVTGAVGSNALVEYTRGSASNEGVGGTFFRQRKRYSASNAPLGDIVSSSPAYVGSPPNRVYDRTDLPGHGSYQSFRSTQASRHPLIYVGANDGMLHAFDASSGKEVFAYIPKALLPRLQALASQSYAHEFYVDGDIVVEDVYDGSSWRTILVASLGRGGKTLFALDVTTPTAVSGGSVVSAVGASTLLWEVSGNSSNHLGHVLGSPVIAPMNDGTWRVVVGNGYNGATDTAKLILIDIFDSSDIVVLDTDSNSAAQGLSGAGGWDDDGDGDVDMLYAGDLAGRLWKFDVSAGNKNSWDVANRSGSSGKPVLTATDSLGTAQPITAQPTVGAHPETGEVWIFFGTGRFITSGDRSDSSIQTWYGVRDNITTDVTAATSRTRSALVERVIKEEGTNTRVDGSTGTYRLISDLGEATGGDSMFDTTGAYVKHGWYIDLVVLGGTPTGEKMLVRNVLLKDILLGSTLIPNNEACGNLGDGWLLAVNPWTAGRPTHSFFDVNGDTDVDDDDRINGDTVTGYKHGNGGIPYLQRCDDGLCVTGTSTDGEEPPSTVNAADGAIRGRLSWRELMGD
ncbi:MAG: hypothetical protein KDH20_08440 [Rhodocyclaceae bacterium]|nr:hypothetical protein [Rhodocyclaceae bacterium]